MSSSRLTKLRNRAAAENAPPPNRNMQQQQPRQQQQQQQNGNVNPMQILQWHETRLKDLLQRFDMWYENVSFAKISDCIGILVSFDLSHKIWSHTTTH